MATAKPRKTTPKYDAAGRVEDYQRALDEGRAQYQQADVILAELLEQVGVGVPVRLLDGREYELVDEFEKAAKVWKPCGVARFTLQKRRYSN